MTKLFDSGFYTENDLKGEGFRELGSNVLIARNCTIVGVQNIEIGDNVRIDSYSSIIAANGGYLKVGSFVHIGGYCLLSATSGILMEDFTGLSQRVSIYSSTDDYTGESLTNPTVPEAYTGVTSGEVMLKKHVIIGSGSVVLPKVTIGEGSAVGALSLVTKSLDGWNVYAGIPARKVSSRSNKVLLLERQLLRNRRKNGS